MKPQRFWIVSENGCNAGPVASRLEAEIKAASLSEAWGPCSVTTENPNADRCAECVALRAEVGRLRHAVGRRACVVEGVEIDLDAIEARATAATPGPWELCDDGYGNRQIAGPEGERMVCFASQDAVCWERDADHVFVIAARDDVPALVARLRALEAAARDVLHECDAGTYSDSRDVTKLDALRKAVG